MEQPINSKSIKALIAVTSVAIPIVVAVLFMVRIPNVAPLSFLPPIYAGINAITALVLVMAVWAMKRGNRILHERLMTTAIVLSLLFLLMYIAYHMTSDPTPFGGTGWVKAAYYFILISHILLSIAVIPLVLVTYSKTYLRDFEAHKKWARYTFPVWFYVAVTGVIVYLMIAPYYA